MKVLVSTSSFARLDPAPLDRLRACGCAVTLNPHGRGLRPEETAALLQGVAGVVAGTEAYPADLLARARGLRVISRVGVGVDGIDLEAASRLGIAVRSTPGAPTEAVAELTLGLILALARRIAEADRTLRGGKWSPLAGRLLEGKTLGVVGLGRIGRRVVELCAPLRMRVLAREPAPDPAFVRRYGVILVDLESLLAEADVVSLHLPLTPETHRLLGPERLGRMRPGALLINTARGGLVDEAALDEALAAGRLAGAALDVFEEEPYAGPLRGLETAVLTAHMGSATQETRIAMERAAVENLVEALGLAGTAAGLGTNVGTRGPVGVTPAGGDR